MCPPALKTQMIETQSHAAPFHFTLDGQASTQYYFQAATDVSLEPGQKKKLLPSFVFVWHPSFANSAQKQAMRCDLLAVCFAEERVTVCTPTHRLPKSHSEKEKHRRKKLGFQRLASREG